MRRALLVTALAGIVLAVAMAVFIRLRPYPAYDLAPGPAIGGVWHVHAEKSHDGHGTLAQAVAAARQGGADFLVMTEHELIRPEAPRRMDGVLVIPGAELSAQAGHVIELGLSGLPATRGPDVVAAIAQGGGEAVLAHPVNNRRPWTDPSTDGFMGFEALSLDSSFRSAPAGRLLLAALALAGDGRKAGAILLDRPAQALARYDEIAASRPLALFCGVDAHGIPAYADSFGALRLYVDLGPARAGFGKDDAADAEAIRAAFRAGRTFCAVPALGDASSFSMVPLAGAIEVKVDAPGATVVVFHDGQELLRVDGPRAIVDPALPGTYRAEVWLRPGFPYRDPALWIVSSALRVSR